MTKYCTLWCTDHTGHVAQVVKIQVTLKIGAGPGSPSIRLLLNNLSNFESNSICEEKNKRAY